jgi:hypothetical protein
MAKDFHWLQLENKSDLPGQEGCRNSGIWPSVDQLCSDFVSKVTPLIQMKDRTFATSKQKAALSSVVFYMRSQTIRK